MRPRAALPILVFLSLVGACRAKPAPAVDERIQSPPDNVMDAAPATEVPPVDVAHEDAGLADEPEPASEEEAAPAEPVKKKKTGIPRIKTSDACVGCGGPYSKEVMKRVIKTHVPEVRACYKATFGKKWKPGGTVKLGFVIKPDGSISGARAKSSAEGTGDVDACIVEAMKSWTFPSPMGGGTIIVKNYKLELKP
jgi:outer membrane biosynthesis protein TonB